MANRISRVRQQLEKRDADAVLLTFLPHVRWACGFTGSNGLLLVSAQSAVFVTDGRYTEQANQEVDGAEVLVATEGLITSLIEEGWLEGLKEVLFQSDHVTVAKRQKLDEQTEDVHWIPASDVLTRAVGQKEDAEVRHIQRAQKVTEAVYDHVLGLLEPGVMEREIAAEITYDHLRRGAEKMAFDPIVASGPNAARPHARPTDRALQQGDLVVLDMGCILNGYASDMTRTVAIGEPKETARKGYDLVLRAQKRVLRQVKAGLSAKEVDGLARDLIEEEGMGEYFSHGLGHGIGLQVHEWPRVSYSSDIELPEGVSITVEPGVYVPKEKFGVRIEDIVVLRSNGSDNLTSTPKSLTIL